MKFFSIGVDKLGLSSMNILDWITRQPGRGKYNERHWIINTDTEFYNPSGDSDTYKLGQFLFACRLNGFQVAIITKYGTTKTDTPPVQEQPSNTDSAGNVPESTSGN